MADLMIPSTSPGKTWALSVFRSHHNGEVYAYAVEGTLEKEGRHTSFTTEHPGSRTVRYILDCKRLTKAAAARGLAGLRKVLADNNLTQES